MDSKVHRFLAVFLLTEAYLCCVDANYKEYVSLISDVHNEYKTSSVFFIFPEKNFRMEAYTTAHSLSRIFSNQGIFTVITNFEDLYDHLNFYQKRITRPLVVVMLKSKNDIDKFDRSTRRMSKSFPIWLMIFNGDYGDPVCEYCRRPLRNRFGLRFDTTMLVRCCDNSTLQEWWSVDGNFTKIGNIGNWTADKRLTLLAIHERTSQRYDIDGLRLRVSLGWNANNYSAKLLEQLQRAMNFIPTMTVPVGGAPAIDNSTTDNPLDISGLMTQGKTDLVVGIVLMTESRVNDMDFTNPFYFVRAKLFFRKPDAFGVHWTAYFEVFELKIWLIIIALIIATAVLLTIVEARHMSKSWISLCIENYICVWGILCQQGSFKFPAAGPIRIVLVSTYISAIVIYVTYSAELISFLATTSSALPFFDLDGFVRDGTYKLVLNLDSPDYDTVRYSAVPIFKKMKMLMKPREYLPADETAAWRQVCSERVALFSNELFRSISDVPCKTVGIDTGHVVPAGLAVPAGSPYTNAFNYYIERFRVSGLFHRLNEKYLRTDDLTSTTYDVVELSRIAPILSILASGIILSIIVLFCEMLYHVHENFRKRLSCEIKSVNSKSIKYFDPRIIENLWKKYSRRKPSLSIAKSDATIIGYCP